jgi:hypothetical protein
MISRLSGSFKDVLEAIEPNYNYIVVNLNRWHVKVNYLVNDEGVFFFTQAPLSTLSLLNPAISDLWGISTYFRLLAQWV